MTETGASVGCVIVNYRTPWEMLSRCLDSIIHTKDDISYSITLVDNASGDSSLSRVRDEYPDVHIIERAANDGFAAAVNSGLDEVDEPYVLLLNTDAVLKDGAIGKMVRSLESAGESCAGVAPKMMSSSHEGIIDAIGTVMPRDGASFNRGIGQCDLGQYDEPQQVFGVCFGAALLRRDLFEPGAVGRLYEDYFLYFEDSDWCMRACSQGYMFLSAPDAVVLHMHSGITRHESLDFKYQLIELNTLKLVVRTFESTLGTSEIVFSRCSRLLARTFIRRRFIAANITTLGRFLAALPALIGERRRLRRRRSVHDSSIFRLSEGEGAYFDTVEYRPQDCLESLIESYRRLDVPGGEPRAGELLRGLRGLQQDGDPHARAASVERLRQLFRDEPACAGRLLESAISSLDGPPQL